MRVARFTQGLDQAELAELVGTTQATVSRLESGRRQPSPALRQRVVAALGLPSEGTPE